MRQLSAPEDYEEEIRYLPYRDSLSAVFNLVVQKAPHGGRLVDMMCGPGSLLGQIRSRRPDLKLTGVDIDRRYLAYARKKYPGARFKRGDVLAWKPRTKQDIVLCTGALHHVEYLLQGEAIDNMTAMLKKNGKLILCDSYIAQWSDLKGRALAAAELGCAYLRETIKNDAPDKVIEWAMNILYNDVMGDEFKTNINWRVGLLNTCFRSVETAKVWPKGIATPYGDYVHICTEPL